MRLSRTASILLPCRLTHGMRIERKNVRETERPRWTARLGAARVTSIALAGCALSLALGASTAHALFLPISHFGSQGSAAGAFVTPIGVAVDQTNGDVYVADSGNARVQKFDSHGTFILAFGWGVADGMAQAEVCTSACLAGIAGSGAGQFSNPTSIAVDSSAGA